MVSRREALGFWFKLGWISFGGPAGQIAIMHEELVERRRWISDGRFLHALNYCLVLPGPEAQQLATYLGWLMHGTWGGIAAGVLFVLPGMLVIIALAWLYLLFGSTGWISAAFYGVKPVVVAIVLAAAWRIGLRTLRSPLAAGIAAAALAAALADLPFPVIVIAAAMIGVAAGLFMPGQIVATGGGHAGSTRNVASPAIIDDDSPTPAHARYSPASLARHAVSAIGLWFLGMATCTLTAGLDGWPTRMALFFTKAALLTFGGAYAVLPYVYEGAVETYGWLQPGQMIDGLALGETTPGPLILVVTFVGFLGGWQQTVPGAGSELASASGGALIATFFTFLPSFLFILAGGPLVEATRQQLRLTAPLTGISAAVVGLIAHLGLVFAGHTFWPGDVAGRPDLLGICLTIAAAGALLVLKISVPWLVAAAAAVGLALRALGLI